MIADTIFTFIIWFVQHGILAVLPSEFSAIPLATYQTTLLNMSAFLTSSFGSINQIFPIYILLSLVIVGITAEIILFGIKATMFILNLVRGAGA